MISPSGLRVTNYIFLTFFVGSLAYHFGVPQSSLKLAGRFLPIAVLAITVVALHKNSKATASAALAANTLLCLLIAGALLYVGFAEAWAVALVSLLPFIPFFVNVYFFAKQRGQNSAL